MLWPRPKPTPTQDGESAGSGWRGLKMGGVLDARAALVLTPSRACQGPPRWSERRTVSRGPATLGSRQMTTRHPSRRPVQGPRRQKGVLELLIRLCSVGHATTCVEFPRNRDTTHTRHMSVVRPSYKMPQISSKVAHFLQKLPKSCLKDAPNLSNKIWTKM